MKGQSQREDRVPCILELLRLAESHRPWFEENILHVKTAGASETYTMPGGKELVVGKEDLFNMLRSYNKKVFTTTSHFTYVSYVDVV